MTPKEWRERVGQHVEARRKERRYRSVRAAAQAAGISETLWRQVESGRRQVAKGIVQTANPGPDKTAAICRALDWSDDSIDLLLQGKQATQIARAGTAVLTLTAQPARAVNSDPKLAALERRLGHGEEFAAEQAARLDRLEARLDALDGGDQSEPGRHLEAVEGLADAAETGEPTEEEAPRRRRPSPPPEE
jgi:hypothetical protein